MGLGPHLKGSFWVVRGRPYQLRLARLFGIKNITILMVNSSLAEQFAEFANRIDHRAGISDNLARLIQHVWVLKSRKMVKSEIDSCMTNCTKRK